MRNRPTFSESPPPQTKTFWGGIFLITWLSLGTPLLTAATVLHVIPQNASSSDKNSGEADAPFKTISEALKRVQPGQIVRIAAGNYREELQLQTSGTADARIIIEAAPGARVVINGADPVTGWQIKPASSQDAVSNRVEVWSAEMDWVPDMVFVEGRLATVSPQPIPQNPGEYALEGKQPPFRLLLASSRGQSPNDQTVEASRRRSGFIGQGISYVTLCGIEVSGVQGSGINFAAGSFNTVESCIVHHCRIDPETRAAFGIGFGGQSRSSIRRCISVKNSYGISVSGSSDCVLEENISGVNTVDAFLITWKSRRITLRKNYAFDNWAERHPDGLQTYRDVSELTLDSNVFLNVGQGWQCQETQTATVTNNIWAGIHWGYAISCSLRHSTIGVTNRHHVFRNNTFYGGMVLTGGESRFVNNLVIPPALGGCPGGPPIESDYNLLWTDSTYYFRWTKPDGSAGKSSNFKTYQQATRDNLHSQFARPVFRNGPAFFRNLFVQRGKTELKPDRTQLFVGDMNGFAVGDWVEIDCDGTPRQITALADGYATVSPSCEKMPLPNLSFLWNWKQNTNFRLDLRLKPGSPGAKMTRQAQDVGSNVNIQDWMRGDFDGDGTQEAPTLPRELLERHPLLQLERRKS
ncbi:MAG: right-handed parallel beta-helix repeat-containing protein [Akkermansiaceae bacterium]|nr:right-handed parallel beta-helix repeat-containing protein [Verrucomicrobiales bacterium]